MERVWIPLQLNVRGAGSQKCVYLRQGDTACTLQVTFSNGHDPQYLLTGDCTVFFRAKLPGGQSVVDLCEKGENGVTYTLTPNTTAAPGKILCEFLLVGEQNAQLATPKFTLVVEPTVGQDTEITQTAEFSAFTTEINRMKQVEAQCLAAAVPGPQGEQGEKGEDGYTPVKGVDYWTAEDKQAILDELGGRQSIPLEEQGYMEGGNGWNRLTTTVSTARNSGWVKIPSGYTHIAATLRINKYGWAVLFATGNGSGLILDSTVSVLGGENNHHADYFVEIPNNAQYVMVSTYFYEGTSACFTNAESNTEEEAQKDPFEATEFSLFKQWGIVGDSLSVGHTADSDGNASSPNLDYSWGQYLARRLGNTCLHFGRSGVSSKEWMTTEKGYPALVKPENLCQCYILALGANDTEFTLGSMADVDFSNMENNADTEYGHYAKVINAIRTTAPQAPIFMFTLPYPRNTDAAVQAINGMIRELAQNENFTGVYLVDLDAHYNEYFKEGKLGNCIGNTGWHLTPLGYLYASVVNEIAVSHVMAQHPEDFQNVFQIPYGTPPETTTTEEWVFELEDGSTVTKEVMVG